MELKRLRKEAKLSGEELSKLTGLNINTIYNLEKGHTSDLKISTLDKICKALKCRYKDLFPDNEFMR